MRLIIIMFLLILCSCHKAEHKDVFGVVEPAGVYNEHKELIGSIDKNTKVFVLDTIIGDSTLDDSVRKVMFANVNGDFINGSVGYVPVRKLKIDKPQFNNFALFLFALFCIFIAIIWTCIENYIIMKRKADKYDELYARAIKLEKELGLRE